RGDVLTPTEVRELYNDGPGTALTAPSGTLPRLAGDDVMYGRDGNDEVKGWAGDDKLHGNDGNDTVEGHYGDDILFGGNGHDVLNGGRGSDLVIGGKGNDILIGGGDAGEDRLGQIVLDQNSRNLGPDEDPSISSQYLKLIDWTDQALVADDVYVGGEGNDHFLFETYINAKKDIILEHAMPNRMIHWHGVAGENKYLHDHWVDSWGIEIVADYNRDEDKISVLGHTVQIEIDYKAYDSDGDGVNDAVASIISPYSQQGKNGGAHDEDGLGHIVVFGDMVYEEDVITDAGVHYGIVDTLDELQEALAPTGEGKVTTLDDGTVIYGYDSRDVDGDPIGSDPLAFSENPYLDRVDLVHNGASTNGATVVAAHGAGSFDGTGGYRLPHHPAQALDEGTISFRFTADDPANGDQALYSKDHSGYKTGGHLTISLDSVGRVVVRMQDTEKGVFMRSKDSVEANTPTDLAFTFSDERLVLYIDGVAVDTEVGMPGGMTGNSEDAMLGASTRLRRGIDDRLEWFFSGTIEEVAMTDRALEHEEVILLDDFDSAISNLAGIEPYDAGAYTPREPVLDEGTPASSLMTFGLYDTETDKLVAELGQGAELDAAVLAGRPLAIVATPEEGVDIGSVRFEHDGSKKTESHLPFAQFGDWGGDLQGGAPYGQGDHTVKITAYEGASASGAVLETVDLSFSVVDGSGSASGGASGGSGSNSGGAGAPKMEVGTLSMIQQNEDAWYSVSFSEAIPDARVVMGPLSMNGDHPVSVRVRDITETGFEFQIDEWNYLDGSHGREEISWMAVSAGTHTLGSGQTISAGRTSLVDETPTTVQLAGFDDAPIVLTQVTTDNGQDAVVTRIRNVTEDRFSFKMQEEEALPDKHVVEAADWIAIEGGTAGRVDAFTVDGVTNQLRTVNFDAVNGELGVLGAMQTMNGPDTAGLRIDDATGRSLKVRVEEERSLDDETYHTAETVGLVTLGTGLYELA
ncbi:MAG: LamG-like jellyroll fold domain-containing protein, partial [Pseudomonadota bacterium]